MVRKQAGSPTEFSIIDNRHPQQFTADFLRRVLDALPESLVVIDCQRNIVMANREALREQTSLKCYQCFHHNEHACSDVSCPVECVLDSKGQVRVYHTHFDRSDREVSVSIDAAPIFDDQGEVAYIIEACRDVTERTLSRRLSRIGNRHIAMEPLLTEFTDEIRRFTCCSHVALYPYHESAVSDADGVVDRDESAASAVFVSARRHDAKPNCSRLLHPDLRPFLPPVTDKGSLRFDSFSEFLSRLPADIRARLGSCGEQPCDSVALVKITHADATIGLLCVADPTANLVSEEMVASLERFSPEIGAAMHRVELNEALEEARGELEERVRERTAALMQTNQALQQEIAERSRLERQLLQATVQEQQRIGQELHDGLGQELTGISYLVQNLLVALQRKNAPETELAAELARGIRTVVGDIQEIVRGLVPLDINAANLSVGLEMLTDKVEKQTEIACHFRAEGDDVMMDNDTAVQLYRIAQEAITNAVKHAQPENIEVRLTRSRQAILLEVADDGVGIEATDFQSSGCGLRSLRYRARAIGGEVDIQKRPNRGTVVLCRVEYSDSAKMDARSREHGV